MILSESLIYATKIIPVSDVLTSTDEDVDSILKPKTNNNLTVQDRYVLRKLM